MISHPGNSGDGEIVSLSGIKLSFGGTPVLKGVDLNMKYGEVYGMLGPSGAGKSTTLSIVAGLRSSDEGTATVLGKDPAGSASDLKHRIGFMSQNTGFYALMTGREYLRWLAELYGRCLGDREADVLLERVGVRADNRACIGGYSRGLRQRLGLARALLNSPALLVLDEPTSGLVPEERRDIHDLILELNHDDGLSILVATHIPDDVERLCGRVGIISMGRTVLQSETVSLQGNSEMATYRLRVRSPATEGNRPLPSGVRMTRIGDELLRVQAAREIPADPIWQALSSNGWDLVEIRREERSLEQAYLAAISNGELDESAGDLARL